MIYTGTVTTPTGKYTFAVEALCESDAKYDLRTMGHAETHAPYGAIRVSDVKRSNRRILGRFTALAKLTMSDGQPWAWIKN